MQTFCWQILVLIQIILCGVNYIQSIYVEEGEWNKFKNDYNIPDYGTDTAAERRARINYGLNKKLVDKYNARNRNGYTLNVNQFSVLRLAEFNNLFPKTTQPIEGTPNSVELPQEIRNAMPIGDYSILLSGINPTIQNQGISCSFGWAYATASSIQIRNAAPTQDPMPDPLSAQQLIDCAGMNSRCTTQVPQTAFEYLITPGVELSMESQYMNRNGSSEEKPCLMGLPTIMPGIGLAQYSTAIKDGDDLTLRKCISFDYPVVTEFNPTSFEFMHYSGGLFTQPAATGRGSHYMLVVGYDADSWLLQNSFGPDWGENGYMRLKRNDTNAKLPISAILPLEIS